MNTPAVTGPADVDAQSESLIENDQVRTMRSIVAPSVGEPSEVLQLQACPVPEPGPGQVRIRIIAVPVEASDLHAIRGRYGFVPEFPTVPGIECVGVIHSRRPRR